MGTMIHLSVGNLEIDWGKNRGFTDHSPMYQVTDVASIPSWFVADHERGSDNWKLFADYNNGYSAPLWKVIERLTLLGYTERVIKKHYEHNMDQFSYEGQPVAPDYETLKQFFATFDFAMILDDERKINRTLGKDLSNQLLTKISQSDVVIATLLRDVFEGESIHFSPYTLLYLFSANPNAVDLPVRWDFDGLVQSGWAPIDEFIRPLDPPNRFLIVTEGSSDAAIIRHAFSILKPYIQDFFRYVDMHEGYPFSGTGNLVNFVKGLISIGIQNNVIIVFDNDAEGLASYNKCMEMNIPENMRIIKLPDLPEFESFNTIGPNGAHMANINGKAAAIEYYLSLENDSLVRWSNFNVLQQTYHGALIAKDEYKKAFLGQREKISDYDYSKINTVLTLIANTAVNIKETALLLSLDTKGDQ